MQKTTILVVVCIWKRNVSSLFCTNCQVLGESRIIFVWKGQSSTFSKIVQILKQCSINYIFLIFSQWPDLFLVNWLSQISNLARQTWYGSKEWCRRSEKTDKSKESPPSLIFCICHVKCWETRGVKTTKETQLEKDKPVVCAKWLKIVTWRNHQWRICR